MRISGESVVGEIVKENFKTAQVFERRKIDFCCGGDITLKSVCAKSKIDLENLVEELQLAMVIEDPDSIYFNTISLPELCNYIEKRHHTYVRSTAPFLQQKLQKLCEVHGSNHPELFAIQDEFNEAVSNLMAHMEDEEKVLFPVCRELGSLETDKDTGQRMLNSIAQMKSEHDTEGDRFKRISVLSNNYTCPPDGCNTFRVTFQTLKDFEDDLHRHIHLENNILFIKTSEIIKTKE